MNTISKGIATTSAQYWSTATINTLPRQFNEEKTNLKPTVGSSMSTYPKSFENLQTRNKKTFLLVNACYNGNHKLTNKM